MTTLPPLRTFTEARAREGQGEKQIDKDRKVMVLQRQPRRDDEAGDVEWEGGVYVPEGVCVGCVCVCRCPCAWAWAWFGGSLATQH